jgi:hypothetical protein
MMNAIAQTTINSQMIWNSFDTIGANLTGGVNGSNGNQARSSGHQSPTHTYTPAGKIPRPLYQQFQGGQ